MPALQQRDPYWGQKALEFVDSLEAAANPEQVLQLFNSAIGAAGFTAYAMIGLPDAVHDFPTRLLANGWPPAWSELYIKERMWESDPVARNCLVTGQPFEWQHAPFDAERDKPAQQVMDRALDFGMRHGFCIPIHNADGSGAAVTMAGRKPDTGHGVRAAVLLMSLYAHHKVRSMLAPVRYEKRLTKRESECLSWAARGKSSWEISVILHISERTVNSFLTQATQKLNASNRTEAVVIGLRAREIAL